MGSLTDKLPLPVTLRDWWQPSDFPAFRLRRPLIPHLSHLPRIGWTRMFRVVKSEELDHQGDDMPGAKDPTTKVICP